MIALTVALVALSYIFYFREGAMSPAKCNECNKKNNTCTKDQLEYCFYHGTLGRAHGLGVML